MVHDYKKVILFMGLLIMSLLILQGVSATSDNVIGTESNDLTTIDDSIPDNEITVNNIKEESSTQYKKNEPNANKSISKADTGNSLKESTGVSDYDELYDALTSQSTKNVEINLQDDIKLEGGITLNPIITNLKIEGNGYKIDGKGKYQFLIVNHKATVVINNINIDSCEHNEKSGGTIYQNDGSLTILNSKITNGKAGTGGAIYVESAKVLINNSVLSSNRATGTDIIPDISHISVFGGAIYSKSGDIVIDKSEFNNNNATTSNDKIKYDGSAYGGAIFTKKGSITISNSVFSENSASGYSNNLLPDAGGHGGAIYSGSTMSLRSLTTSSEEAQEEKTDKTVNIINSSFKFNKVTSEGGSDSYGGAIATSNKLIVNDSEFSINEVITDGSGNNYGGAIYVEKATTIERSHFENNFVSIDGEGLAYGGAVYASNKLTITDTGFVSNICWGEDSDEESYICGGAIYSEGNLKITNSRLNSNYVRNDGKGTTNGGSICSVNSISIEDSTLSYNFAESKNDADSSGGAIFSYDTITITNSTVTKNMVNSSKGESYGGAIFSASKLTITLSNIIENEAISGDLCKGGAIYQLEDSQVKITSTIFNRNQADDGGALYSLSKLTIKDSAFTNNLAMRGGANYIDSDEDCSITNTTFNDNNGTYGGANYVWYSDVSIDSSVFSNNEAKEYGGANYNHAGNLTLINSKFSYNNAIDGGANCNRYNGNITIINSIVTNNSALNRGGVIFNDEGVVNVVSSVFINNNAVEGGVINNDKGIIVIDSSGFVYNNASKGGVVYNNNGTSQLLSSYFINNTAINGSITINLLGTLSVNNSLFSNNNATDCGGVNYNYWGTVDIDNSTFSNNNATRSGGANYNYDGSIEILNSIFKQNTAWEGGANYNHQGLMSLRNSTLTDNKATYGGGANCNENGNMEIINSNLTDNIAIQRGGANYNKGENRLSYIKIIGSLFSNNKAKFGGANYNKPTEEIYIINSTFNNNYAGDGGANYNEEGIVSILNTVFMYNIAGTGGANYNYKGSMSVRNSSYNKNIPANFIIDENNNIVLNNSDGYISPGTVAVYLDGNDKPVYTGSLDNYVVPNGNHTIRLLVNGTDIKTFEDNDFILESYINGTNIVVDEINSFVGENVTLTAHVTDGDNLPVNEGKVTFLLDDKEVMSEGSVPVIGGVAHLTILADNTLLNVSTLSAQYIGTAPNKIVNSNSVDFNVSKRLASIALDVTPSTQMQYKNVTFTATVKDITPNHQNNTALYDDSYVSFLVNVDELTDDEGNVVHVSLDEYGVASYDYNIKAGTNAIDVFGRLYDYIVTAEFVSDIYEETSSDECVYHVEQSPINIVFNNASVDLDNVLHVSADILDYMGNHVIGISRLKLNINDEDYTDENGTVVVYNVNDGVVSLDDVQLPENLIVLSLMLEVMDSSAYLNGQNVTYNITYEGVDPAGKPEDNNNTDDGNDTKDNGDDVKPGKVIRVNSYKYGKNSVKALNIITSSFVLHNNMNVTLEDLNDIFDMDFTNGVLLIYLDGKLVFNGTTTDDLAMILFELVNELLGEHELKVVFTDENNVTRTYVENVIIN